MTVKHLLSDKDIFDNSLIFSEAGITSFYRSMRFLCNGESPSLGSLLFGGFSVWEPAI